MLDHEGYPVTGFDLSLFDVRTKKATNLMPVKDNQAQGQFGTAQRVAYMSTEVTEPNVFVRRLDGVSGSERISSTAGFDPRWRADGRELYFLDPAGWLIAAQFPDDGLKPSAVKPLFKVHVTAPTSPYSEQLQRGGQWPEVPFPSASRVAAVAPHDSDPRLASAAVTSLIPPPRPIQKVRRAHC